MNSIEYLWSADDIRQQVAHMANEINERESMRPEIVMPILNAASIFCSDLLRQLWPETNPIVVPIRMKRSPLPSQPEQFVVTGPLNSPQMPVNGIQGKRVLLIDTVYDSGGTLRKVHEWLYDKRPRSIQSACLVWKNLPHAHGKPDYYAYDMSGNDRYLIGYGLDGDELYRGMPDIGYLKR